MGDQVRPSSLPRGARSLMVAVRTSDNEEASSDLSNRARAAALSGALKKRGNITSNEVALAFSRVNRSAFVPASWAHCAWDDAPLRAWDDGAQCVVHLSAPSIYATALEALDLTREGPEEAALSFLNIGSGSGYFSALAATILGPRSVHHCVEISAPLAARCRATFEEACRDSYGDDWSDAEDERPKFGAVPELAHVNVHVASCFDLALDDSMKFDRIYVGAGARASDARFLSKLLKPGGIIVGPFERDNDRPPRAFSFGTQSLLRATRSQSPDADCESCFEVDELMAVQFAPLSRRVFALDGSLLDADFAGLATQDDAAAAADDDRARPVEDASTVEDRAEPAREAPALRLFTLRGPTWGLDAPDLFAPCFVRAVLALRAAVASTSRHDALARVPWHVWELNIWPLLAHDDILCQPKPPLKRCGDAARDHSPKRRFAHPDRRLGGATVAAARRSFAIARAVARWTLARLAS